MQNPFAACDYKLGKRNLVRLKSIDLAEFYKRLETTECR
jgi:uncharacterized Fe-S cluster-containing radical SAM superfamily enzyme